MINYKFVRRCMNFVTLQAERILKNTDEIPVVCLVITDNGEFFFEHNRANEHAEMIILSKYNCRNAFVFVNVEPCPMCLFALSLAKVKVIFFGCNNDQYGACGGKFYLRNHIDYNIPRHIGGFFDGKNKEIIQKYFEKKRLNSNTIIKI